MTYRSPVTGAALAADTPHSLAAAGERWPVVDGIAYLRAGSEERAAAALAALDAGDADAARVLLLAENDRWWEGAPPPDADLRRLIAEREALSLREAMGLLGWGRVGDYFAHRWSDPTYLAGLALLDAHWTGPATAFELACGIGHYLRALAQAGVAATGADVVFAKLWVARHWVAPDAVLVCFDADRPWPVAPRVGLALCHDAFYFLADKPGIAARLCQAAPLVVLSHVHNRDWPNLSGGAAMTRGELAALFPGAALYDDAELTEAAVAGVAPGPIGDAAVEAFGLVHGAAGAPGAAVGPLSLPPAGRALVRNPLCRDGAIAWPSDRYRAEYAGRATYTCADVPPRATMGEAWRAAAARRELIDLPARW
jgi:hypothetical protein